MAIVETIMPYEFLARWDEQGQLKGAHLVFMTRIIKDGEVIALSERMTKEIALAVGDQGFPLSEILPLLHISSIDAMNTAKKDLADTKTAHKQELKDLKKQHDDEIATMTEAVVQLEAENLVLAKEIL